MLVFLPNCPQFLVAALGAFRAGVVFSPVNPQYKRREVAYQLEGTEATVIVTHSSLQRIVDEAREGAGWSRTSSPSRANTRSATDDIAFVDALPRTTSGK
ncbi:MULTISPECIES: AMP-binding protein [Natrialbaceae]|uniref:AMP-binding protein n=1 Tax=Natrialbaceae TaxID=1644061 RepID=UPI0031F2E939